MAVSGEERVLAAAAGVTAGPGSLAYVVIADWLSSLIDDGTLTPGDRIPAERALAPVLGVSRMTLRQALRRLKDEGRLVGATGTRGGTVVAVSHRPRVDVGDLQGLRAQLLQSDESVTSRLVVASTVPAPPAVQHALELRPSTSVHQVSRVRFAGGRPVVLERSFFPADLFPDLLETDLSGSLYEVLGLRYGRPPVSAEEELVPILPTAEDRGHLELARATPVLKVVRTASDAAGVPVEHSEDLFRSDLLRLTVTGRLTAHPTSTRRRPS